MGKHYAHLQDAERLACCSSDHSGAMIAVVRKHSVSGLPGQPSCQALSYSPQALVLVSTLNSIQVSFLFLFFLLLLVSSIAI